MYSKDVAPDRRTFRTVFRDSFSSRAISLIVLPLTKCSRLIRPIVSTTNIPRHPLGIKAGQPAIVKRGQSWTPITPLQGQSSTPDHTDRNLPPPRRLIPAGLSCRINEAQIRLVQQVIPT